jgi:hypothetical protein
MPPRTEKLLAELKSWCTDQSGRTIRGRNAEAGRAAGTTRQAVNDWFAGKRQPTAEQALAILEFLKAEGAKKSSRGKVGDAVKTGSKK